MAIQLFSKSTANLVDTHQNLCVRAADMMRRAWSSYTSLLKRKPLATQMGTSVVTWSLGDIISQSITCDQIDFTRTAKTGAFAAMFIGPVGHGWYKLMDHFCITVWQMKQRSLALVATKVSLDMAIFSPFFYAMFFPFATIVRENGTMAEAKERLKTNFIPTLTVEIGAWTPIQTFTFYKVPVQHQLLFVNTLCLVDAAFISWAGTQDDWLATAKAAFYGLSSDEQTAVVDEDPVTK